jgi:hypothetical protein
MEGSYEYIELPVSEGGEEIAPPLKNEPGIYKILCKASVLNCFLSTV